MFALANWNFKNSFTKALIVYVCDFFLPPKWDTLVLVAGSPEMETVFPYCQISQMF